MVVLDIPGGCAKQEAISIWQVVCVSNRNILPWLQQNPHDSGCQQLMYKPV